MTEPARRSATRSASPGRTIAAIAVAASLAFSFPGPAGAVDVKQMVLDQAKAQFWANLEKSNPDLAKTLKDAGESKWAGYAGKIAQGKAREVVAEIYKAKKAEMWKAGKKHAIASGVIGKDTFEWLEKHAQEAGDIAAQAYIGDYKGAGNTLMKALKKEYGPKVKKDAAELIDFFLKDIIGEAVGKRYLAFLAWEMEPRRTPGAACTPGCESWVTTRTPRSTRSTLLRASTPRSPSSCSFQAPGTRRASAWGFRSPTRSLPTTRCGDTGPTT
jgi:hypothetical protein